MPRHPARWAVLILPLLGGCSYLGLLRPRVLQQLRPPLVRLVNYLPEVDRPNDAIVGRLFAQGGLSRAGIGADGVMRSRVQVAPNATMWVPSIVVLPRGGTLELEVANADDDSHVGFFPDNGANQVLILPPHTAGRVRVTLDSPGLYTFAEGTSNNAGRGMLGVVIVEGRVPPEARLDRPAQPQPRR